MKILNRKEICLVVGHEPGGGAKNEREWNLSLSTRLAKSLEELGAEVFIYTHRTRAYSRRCSEMRAGVKKHMPGADCVVLMHYNSVDYPEAHGHEFHYHSTPAIAKAFRDAWQKHFPWSRARQDNGILENRNGRGSRMLRLAPAAAVLLEPFFYSNTEERNRCFSNPDSVCSAYVEGLCNFLS